MSVYILALCGPVLTTVLNSDELSRSFRSSLGMTGLGLFLTGIIATSKWTITLFHAICLFHLLCLIGISLIPKGEYSVGRIGAAVFAFLQEVFLCGFLAWDIHLFATAPTYGSQSECNGSIIYVIFGFNIPATSPIFRWLVIAALGVVLFFSMVSVLGMTREWCSSQGEETGHEVENAGEAERYRNPTASAIYVVGHLAGSAYIIGMIEMMIKRNKVDHDEFTWTFGQLLAMLMLIGPLIELVSLFLEKIEKNHVDAADISGRRSVMGFIILSIQPRLLNRSSSIRRSQS